MLRDELRVRRALSALEAEFAGALFELAGELVAAHALGRGEIVKLRFPTYRVDLQFADVAIHPVNRDQQGR